MKCIKKLTWTSVIENEFSESKTPSCVVQKKTITTNNPKINFKANFNKFYILSK